MSSNVPVLPTPLSLQVKTGPYIALMLGPVEPPRLGSRMCSASALSQILPPLDSLTRALWEDLLLDDVTP